MDQKNFDDVPIEDDLKDFRPIKRGGIYICPWKEFQRPGIPAVLHWKFCIRDDSNIPRREVLDRVLPVTGIQRSHLENPPEGKIKFTWIGHATVLLQFDGITILTDPVFRHFAGPEIAKWLPCFGYRRYREAACLVSDIPKPDAVIISHNHHDHLDVGSVKEVTDSFPDVHWLVPEGLGGWFRDKGCKHVTELTWWQEVTLTVNEKDFKFICTPSQHWCQRSILDLNKCLWCSWVVQGPSNRKFFYGGDTGYYEPLFKKIGEKYGPFSLAAIPIGAYHPRKITSYQHVDPEEAVRIHVDIKSEMSIGIHWGTFALTNEYYLDPPRAVEELMQHKKLDPNKFISLCHGETWVVGEQRDPSPFMMQKSKDSEDSSGRQSEN